MPFGGACTGFSTKPDSWTRSPLASTSLAMDPCVQGKKYLCPSFSDPCPAIWVWRGDTVCTERTFSPNIQIIFDNLVKTMFIQKQTSMLKPFFREDRGSSNWKLTLSLSLWRSPLVVSLISSFVLFKCFISSWSSLVTVPAFEFSRAGATPLLGVVTELQPVDFIDIVASWLPFWGCAIDWQGWWGLQYEQAEITRDSSCASLPLAFTRYGQESGVLKAQTEYFLRVFTAPREEFPPTGSTGRRDHRFRASGQIEFHERRHESALSCGFIPLPSIGLSRCAQHPPWIPPCLFITCFLDDEIVFVWFNTVSPAFNLQKSCFEASWHGVYH